jgi:phage tail sheath gpL-like
MYQVTAATDKVDTMANIQTLCGTTMNDSRLTLAYASYASDNLAKSEEYKLAASYAGIISSQSDPVVPLNGLPLVGLAAPSVVDRLTRTQQETLLNAGVTPLEVVSNELVVVRSITTNTTVSGVPSPVLLDIQTLRTLDHVRNMVRTRLVLRFPRAKMSTKTPARVRSQVLDVLYLLEQLEIVQNVKQYESGVICEQDSSDVTRVNVKIPTNIVTGLHVIACLESLILGI